MTPRRDAKVIIEFSAGGEGVLIMNVTLKILGIAVHGSKLVDMYHSAMLAETREADENGSSGFEPGGPSARAPGNEVDVRANHLVSEHFEPREDNAPKCLRKRERPVGEGLVERG